MFFCYRICPAFLLAHTAQNNGYHCDISYVHIMYFDSISLPSLLPFTAPPNLALLLITNNPLVCSGCLYLFSSFLWWEKTGHGYLPGSGLFHFTWAYSGPFSWKWRASVFSAARRHSAMYMDIVLFIHPLLTHPRLIPYFVYCESCWDRGDMQASVRYASINLLVYIFRKGCWIS